ncbi:hypothetical protein ASPSYDRAFT_1124618 [Aspergillus sydowii CBS 593.65]|uniref:BHLH domain-containing protein n=1 Tax=Aspergillus sydowii CBS 593.65 TaxID=1036612 RepID=A0A1L9TCU5_9EURO|nr:uncharacterized protein ASPSYDRAFT_1124618 [Aspergillus sydowii CBS 593.65]OJJ57221.1 hypothetical protein ASPSYDRAFT_1124618 [Aspergillus sydowii CBS 593.65]
MPAPSRRARVRSPIPKSLHNPETYVPTPACANYALAIMNIFPKLIQADFEGRALPAERLWEHAPTPPSTKFNNNKTASPREFSASSSNSNRLNWGSDMCFQPNANYTVPEYESSEEAVLARLFENLRWLILHLKDMGLYQQEPKQPQQQQKQQQQQQPQPRRSKTSRRARSVRLHDARKPKRPLAASLQRQAAHIRSEQKRRSLVNNMFDEVRLLVPGLRGESFSKSQTLRTVCDYVEELSRVNEALKEQLAELEDGSDFLAIAW